MNQDFDHTSSSRHSDDIPVARPIPQKQTMAPSPRGSDLNPQMPPDLSWPRAVAEIILGGVALLFGMLLTGIVVQSPEQAGKWLPLINSLCMGGSVMLACFAMVLANNHSLRSIGWHSDDFGKNVAIGIGGLLVTYLLGGILLALTLHFFPSIKEEAVETQKRVKETFPEMSFSIAIMVMLFVAIWEEIAFRGFLLTRLYAICGRWWLSILVMAILFGIAHSYEGSFGIAGTAGLGVAMSILTAWRKSLVPAMTFHLIHNTLAIQALKYELALDEQPAAFLFWLIG
jgi:hypothetical protein